MPRLIIIDVDGTLYKKPRMAWYMICAEWRHLHFLALERRLRRWQRQHLGQDLHRCHLQKKKKFWQRFEAWYSYSYLPTMVEVIRSRYTLQPWVKPLLNDCHEQHIPVVLLSDYEAVEQKLEVLGLSSSQFAAVFSTADFGTIKPDPILGQRIIEALDMPDIDWRNVLFIGDRPDTDGALATALGAQFRLV